MNETAFSELPGRSVVGDEKIRLDLHYRMGLSLHSFLLFKDSSKMMAPIFIRAYHTISHHYKIKFCNGGGIPPLNIYSLDDLHGTF